MEEIRRGDALDGRQVDGGVIHSKVISLHGDHGEREKKKKNRCSAKRVLGDHAFEDPSAWVGHKAFLTVLE